MTGKMQIFKSFERTSNGRSEMHKIHIMNVEDF